MRNYLSFSIQISKKDTRKTDIDISGIGID